MDALFALSGRVSAAFAVAAKLMIGAIVVLVAADVAARNLARSLVWSVSLVEYLMIYVTFLAMPGLVRSKGHVCADFLRMALPASVQRSLEKAVYLLCIALCVYLGAIAALSFAEAVRSGAYDVRTFDMPRWAIYLPIVVGLVLSAVEFLRYLLGRDSIYAIAAGEREGF